MWRSVFLQIGRSLKARLATWLVVTLVALYVLQGLVVAFMMRHVTEDYVAKRLALDGELLIAGVDVDANGKITFNNDRMPLVYRQPFSGHYYALHSSRQTLLSRSLGGQSLGIVQPSPGTARVEYLEGPLNQNLLAYFRDFDASGHHITLMIAQDLSHLKDEILDLYGYYVAISITALVTLILVQTLIVARGLRPLDQVRHQLRELERGEREHLTEEVPTEITPLVREINHLADALALRIRRLRNATGNLAHALKTPLAVLNRGLESNETPPRVRAELAPQVKIINEFIERELKRARLAAGRAIKTRFAPEEDIQPLVQSLGVIYREKGLIFDVQTVPAENFVLDREDMLELIGNLLDNAAKWARDRVRFSMTVDGDLRIVVEDDGPGVDDALLQGLTLRGARIDESMVGHGLGLAIVQDIVENYRGRLQLGRSQRLGGFMVQVSIPLRTIRPRMT